MNSKRLRLNNDYSHHVNKHRSVTLRMVLFVLGSVFVVAGIIGLFLPVLPTTPFLLLAAACYARASTRFYNRLLNTPAFGPAILEWREYRSIPYRIKWLAIGVMLLSMGTSLVFFVSHPYARAALALVGVAVCVWLWRLPSRDGPGSKA